MPMFRNFEPRFLRPRLAVVIGIALLCCWNGGCAKRVSYVSGSHKLTRLDAGQPAPHPGVLMSEEYLSEIFEALRQP